MSRSQKHRFDLGDAKKFKSKKKKEKKTRYLA